MFFVDFERRKELKLKQKAEKRRIITRSYLKKTKVLRRTKNLKFKSLHQKSMERIKSNQMLVKMLHLKERNLEEMALPKARTKKGK